ncbi:unnamed protein product [Brachionus calyciflorus]|uniref:Peptidase A2 domain-containing protein n=1 Tax=Brachionus calyciflorus TaxID=104777 RepID=A0A814LY69_9BILA|nr:unnamed protein product [Brachionus calyciflorus]
MDVQLMQAFDAENDEHRCRRWEEWTTTLEHLMAIKEVSDEKLKKIIYFILLSKNNSRLSSYHFREIFQHQGEPFEDLVKRLKEKAKSFKLRRRALEAEKDLTLEELIKFCKLEESVNGQLKEYNKFNNNGLERYEIDKVNEIGSSRGSNGDKFKDNSNSSGRKNSKSFNSAEHERIKDYRPRSSVCPAKGQKCRKCNGFDHFERCCYKMKNGKVNKIEEESESDLDNFSNIWRVRVKNMFQNVKDWFMPVVMLWLSGISMGFNIDTGAQVNIMDKDSFKRLKFKPKLYKLETKLFGYGQSDCISTLGKFLTRVKYKEQYKVVGFIVTCGSYGNLLSYKTSVELGIMSKINSINSVLKDSKSDQII